jgi:hypothetical protein
MFALYFLAALASTVAAGGGWLLLQPGTVSADDERACDHLRILRPSAVRCASIASIRGAHVMRMFVIVLGCCLAGSPAALGQVTIINPPVAGAPLSPFPPPQYNLPGPQLVVPQPGNPLQQVAPLPSLGAPPGSPIPQLSPLGSTVNPLQAPPGSTVNGFSPALGVNPVQQLGLQSPLQPGLPEAY